MTPKIENRSSERHVLNMPAFIKGQETENEVREDRATISNLSKNSVGFITNRAYKIGRLISLTAQIPLNLRCGEQKGATYTVWGIVQHCNLIGRENQTEKYYLGMALIGEQPPTSYLANPLQNYLLCGIEENGFWKIKEVGREFVVRKHPRFSTMIEVFLAKLDENSNISAGEKVLTDNISMGGVAVFTGLDLTIGESVKIIAAEYEFSALSIVRNVTAKNNKKSKVCLEFAAAKFPIRKLVDNFVE